MSGANKAPRWNVDGETLNLLEQVYQCEPFPGLATREALAHKLDVSGRQIQVWFQNRRQRERKRKNSRENGLLGSSSQTDLGTPALASHAPAPNPESSDAPRTAGAASESAAPLPSMRPSFGNPWPEEQGVLPLDAGMPSVAPHWPPPFPGLSPRVANVDLRNDFRARSLDTSSLDLQRPAGLAAGPSGLGLELHRGGGGGGSLDLHKANLAAELRADNFAELDDVLSLWGGGATGALPHAPPEKLAPLPLMRSGCSDLLGQMRPFSPAPLNPGPSALASTNLASSVPSVGCTPATADALAADGFGPMSSAETVAGAALGPGAALGVGAAPVAGAAASDEAQQTAADEYVQIVAQASPPYRVVWPSKAWCQLFSVRPEAVLGRPLLSVLCPPPPAGPTERSDDAEAAKLFAAVEARTTGAARLAAHASDGSFTHTVRVEALRDSSGEVHLYQFTSSDIVKDVPDGAAGGSRPDSAMRGSMKRNFSAQQLGQQLGTDELLEMFFQ